ncbi:MAG: hypothetical protein ACRDUV_21320 [Pseudonocardiaceae bacterium]
MKHTHPWTPPGPEPANTLTGSSAVDQQVTATDLITPGGAGTPVRAHRATSRGGDSR